ncbi:E2F-associated phosphoprotein [Ixodes scapularis]
MEYNDYHVEDSDDSDAYDSGSSSEDAFQSYVRNKYLSQNAPEETFEKQMQDELLQTFRDFEHRYVLNDGDADRQGSDGKAGTNRTPVSKDGTADNSKKAGSKSDSPKADGSKADGSKADGSKADGSGGGSSKAGNTNPSNDDLLYDPEMDDEDEKWVNEQRRVCMFPDASTSSKADTANGVRPLPTSDAVLNCPACMSVLCLDCQRHEIYNTQYRAMFVKNCVVSDTEVLKCPPSRSKRKKNGGGADDPRDLFRPVRCRVCKTEVAVMDQDEVFHFFNVIASFS